jgi:hypothetical protein
MIWKGVRVLLNKRLADAIVVVVTIVWFINFLAPLFPGIEYQSDPTIHAVFMAVVGGTLALRRNGSDKSGGSNGSKG